MRKGHLFPYFEKTAFYIETVSEGSPSMIQSLIINGSVKILLAELS